MIVTFHPQPLYDILQDITVPLSLQHRKFDNVYLTKPLDLVIRCYTNVAD